MSAIAEALNSRRFVRLLPWLSGAILVAGIVVFLTVYFGRTSVPPVNKAAGPSVRTTDQRTVPLDPKINKLANQFIRVAVGGTDPVQAYMISGPSIRQGMTLAKWKHDWNTIGVPIIPYPVDKVSASPFRIDYSYPNQALLEVALLPKKGAGVKGQIFFIGFNKIGKGANRHWVVNSWAPHNSIATPSQ
jgi:hypothetical protein